MLIQNIVSYEDFTNYINNFKNVIVNISATWCKPCLAIKQPLEKFVSVINETDFIYLKLDNDIYDQEHEFEAFFKLKKIPYFAFVKNGVLQESFVNGDFLFVSQKIMSFIHVEKASEKDRYNDLDKNDDF